MRLVWSPFALADRDEIFRYIETDNPKAAAEIDERIASAVRRLVSRKRQTGQGRRHPRTDGSAHALYRSLCRDCRQGPHSSRLARCKDVAGGHGRVDYAAMHAAMRRDGWHPARDWA